MRTFDLGSLERRDAFHLLTRIVAPRPIAFVSSLAADGSGNLAPFSYFNLGGANPPSVVFSVLKDRHGREKDTLANVRETGEYVISVVTREMAEKMNLASASFPRGVNEFEKAGFTPLPSIRIAPPRVGESPIAMECRLYAIIAHGEGPLSAHYVIGEVLLIHVDEAVLDEAGQPDAARMDLIGRMGGDWYAHTTASALFALPRPPEIAR